MQSGFNEVDVIVTVLILVNIIPLCSFGDVNQS